VVPGEQALDASRWSGDGRVGGTVVTADKSSKLSARPPRVCPLSAIDYPVTDSSAPPGNVETGGGPLAGAGPIPDPEGVDQGL
jgi:hypothetical protein